MKKPSYFGPQVFFLLSVIFTSVVIIATSSSSATFAPIKSPTHTKTPIPSPVLQPTPTIVPTNTPSPTPKPLTFAQMNQLYGPCIHLPVLYYHHVEPKEVTDLNRRRSLAVTPEEFEAHLHYLTEHGYTSIFPADLINFFDSNTPLPPKAVLLTFDDGYSDMFTHAFPLLQKYSIKAALYLPTGLLTNPGYLNWDQISQMSNSGLIYFGNHTWSHKSTKTNLTALEFEITTAATQLAERNLNNPPTFVYPYGSVGNEAIPVLTKYNYKLAFTTHSGSVMCKQLRFLLPRIRATFKPLSTSGL